MAVTNKITNKTIAKLDRNEIGIFGLYSNGIYTYRGTLKARRQGWKTVKVDEKQTNFVGEHTVIEFIQIVPSGDEPEWAMRVKNLDTDSYMNEYPVLWGCDFFK